METNLPTTQGIQLFLEPLLLLRYSLQLLRPVAQKLVRLLLLFARLLLLARPLQLLHLCEPFSLSKATKQNEQHKVIDAIGPDSSCGLA